MTILLTGKIQWHVTGWIVLILFEQFLVSYYTDYHVDLPVGIWHYGLTILLFYTNIWFLQHKYITSKKKPAGEPSEILC